MNPQKIIAQSLVPLRRNMISLMSWGLVLLSLLSMTRFINRADWWLVDLCSHFPVQYGLLALLCVGLAVWKRAWLLGSIAGLLLLINFSVFAEYRSTVPYHPVPGKTFTLYLANVWRLNAGLDRTIDDILQVAPHCVFLMEVTPAHLDPLQPLLQHFPSQIIYPKENTTGFLFLSQYPVMTSQIITRADHGHRAILVAELSIDHHPVIIYGVHPHAPAWRKRFQKRNTQLRWLAERLDDHEDPAIVVGDFNATPFSPAFQAFLTASGLHDPRQENGWYPSWPVYMPLWWLPIDHILVNSQLQISQFSTRSSIGSDHYPVVATLVFSQR
jgi:endonuclease/exonuclease/phosphatase (EEP) superfamily protein YafD